MRRRYSSPLGFPVVCAIAAGLTSIWQVSLLGQGRGAVPAAVTAAADFVLLAYPDLMSRPVNLAFHVTGRTVAVTVTDAPSPDVRPSAPREPLLNAAFTLSLDGELEEYAATGVLVDRTRNEALVKELAQHPTWTDSDADAALQAMGGRPSTGAAPPSPIETQRLERFVGSNPTKMGDATLRWRPSKNGGPSERFAAVPGWTTEVSARKRDGTQTTYRLVFEPFGGRLVMVTQE